MNTKNELAFRLLSIRAKKNITQAELAKELGVSRSYLSCVENGHKQASEFLKMKILNIEAEISYVFSDRIRKLSQKTGLHKKALAHYIGISRAMFYAYLKGESPITPKVLEKLRLAELKSDTPIFKEAIRLLIDADPSISDVDFNKYFKGFLKGYERGFNDAKERISPSFIEIFDLKNKGK